MPTAKPAFIRRAIPKRIARVPPPSIKKLTGTGGARYEFMKLIQLPKDKAGRVWMARSEKCSPPIQPSTATGGLTSSPFRSPKGHFILKDLAPGIFTNYNENIRPHLRENPYIRLPCDTIQDQQIFVYPYMGESFLNLVIRKYFPMSARKKILKDSLRGIAEMHERDVAHLDITPDNIMVDCNRPGLHEETIVENVKLIDFEDAGYVAEGGCQKGTLTGSEDWRSPEAFLRIGVNKPADMFSFAIVCLYAVLERPIFGVDEDFEIQRSENILPEMIRLQRQISYFGTEKGLDGLLHRVDNEVQQRILKMLWEYRFDQEEPYKAFWAWPDIKDGALKDLIISLTDLDPGQRMTAKDALEHPWFEGI